MSETLVLDLEVTVRCPIGTMKANPHWEGNSIVCCAGSFEPKIVVDKYGVTDNEFWEWNERAIENAQVLVGHNFPFDLQWFMRISKGKIDLSGKTIWCTALAEYILSGQTHVMPSLNDLCKKYGLPVKDDKIKEFWDAGHDTTDIPALMLRGYCQGDVRNTRAIFEEQVKEAKRLGMLPLILMLQDALLATTYMMYNGMAVDASSIDAFITIYTKSVTEIADAFKKNVKYNTGFSEINLNSPQQLSALLYGGEVKVKTLMGNGLFKSGPRVGQPRYRTIEAVHKFPGIVDERIIKFLDIPKNEYGYSTAEETLEKLRIHIKHIYIDSISQYREIDKQLNTYFLKTKSLLFYKKYIHHNINTTTTITGRYSSSEPNLQNVTSGRKSDIKRCYISRYGEHGYLIELDFSQLEMVALAQLSGDKQLIADIVNGIDIHSTLYHSLFGRMPTDEERTTFKRASFALIYGAGPKKIARTVGIAEDTAKSFIRAWNVRYPGTVSYWEKVGKEVQKNKEPFSKYDVKTGKPLGISKYTTVTGRILTFTETIRPWDGIAGFSPNDTKNYPIQSFATGDLIPLFIGKLCRKLISKEGRELFDGKRVKDSTQQQLVALVNTVHDSVVLDCHEDMVDDLVKVLRNTVDMLPVYIKETWGIEMLVPLRVNISKGRNWCEQEDVEAS